MTSQYRWTFANQLSNLDIPPPLPIPDNTGMGSAGGIFLFISFIFAPTMGLDQHAPIELNP